MCPYTPIQLERIYEQIIAQIEHQIISGALKPGDKLPPERDLADQFRVSRTAVREAVKALQEKGLVEVSVGRGTFIINDTSKATSESLGLMMKMSANTRAGFADLFELRNILEPELAALAAIRRSADDIIAMERAIDTMDASMDDMEAYIAADNLFHQAIAIATQNILFAPLLDPIIHLLIEQRRANFLAGVQSPQHAQNYHKKILKAISIINPDDARQAMKSHLEQVIVDIKR
jgi:GntR family transcriptional repressor for pyruvate dehydrogenase complex